LEQIENFESVDAFLEKYGERLRDLDLLEAVDPFRGANHILVFHDVSMTESVIAYNRSTDPEWMRVTEERLKSDFILTAPFRCDPTRRNGYSKTSPFCTDSHLPPLGGIEAAVNARVRLCGGGE